MSIETRGARLQAAAGALLQQVDTEVERADGALKRLRNLQPADIAAASASLAAAFEAIRGIRELVDSAGAAGASWEDRASFETLLGSVVTTMDDAEARIREMLAGLSEVLAKGEVKHRVAALRATMEALRETAAAELAVASRSANPTPLPGPQSPEMWLGWAWDHRELPELRAVESYYPELANFVLGVERTHLLIAPSTPVTMKPLATSAPDLPFDETAELSAGSLPSAVPVTVEAPAPPAAASASALQEEFTPGAAAPVHASARGAHGGTTAQLALNGAESQPFTQDGWPPPSPQNVAVEPLVAALNPLGPDEEGRSNPPAPEPAAAVEAEIETREGALERVVIPEELASFEAFRRIYWVGPHGRCESAPWHDPVAFGKAVDVAQRAALADRDFAKLHVLAKAGEELGIERVMSPREVETAAQLQASPANAATGINPQRSKALAEAAFGGWNGSPTALKLAVFFEAVRPSPELFQLANAVPSLLDAASFQDRELSNVVAWLLKASIASLDGLERLRAGLKDTPRDPPAKLQEQLAKDRETFHMTVTTLWSAAGGKIERTHCRQAWADFRNEYKEFLQGLYPVPKGGKAEWDVKECRKTLSGMLQRYTEISNKAAALHGDRVKMDRAARVIVDAAAAINATMEMLAASLAPPTQKVDVPITVEQLNRQRPTSGDPAEAFCWELLSRLLSSSAASPVNLLGLRPRHLVEYPDLVACLDGLDREELKWDANRNEPLSTTVTSAVQAAALLCGPAFKGPDLSKPVLSLLTAEFERRGRGDLMYRLNPFMGAEEQAHLQRERAQTTDRIMAVVGDCVAAWQVLDALADSDAPGFKRITDDARNVVTDEPRSSRESMLIAAWVERLRALAIQARDVAVDRLKKSAGAGAQRQRLASALKAGDHLGALMTRLEATRTEVAVVRETQWRSRAITEYERPADALEVIRREIPRAAELIDLWTRGLQLNGRLNDRKLRSTFMEGVLGEKELTKRFERNNTELTVATTDVREWVAGQGLNPSFIPQLARYNRLVITTPSVSLNDSSVVVSTAAEATKYTSSFVVVLTPGLTARRRKEFRDEFAKRKLAAAVLDDVDLVRLFNPGGRRPNGLIGLLEVLLEQQTWSWSTLSPFASHEGQHVQMEMYVGRHDDVNLLSTTANYSRLFSGRKLGKSALLKHMEVTRSGTKLPSDCYLKVLYVLIAGAATEQDVTERIIETMAERLNLSGPAVNPQHDAPKALETTLKAFLDKRSRESVLIILDEADAFVEAQLEEFDRRREGTLSWKMRSLESHKDEHGFPRIRFLFSGYRATQTTGGAWANWGDVRKLAPLAPDEATRLIEGPLARMGIDARAHAAAIAWRCGYQPAVLLRFGQQLLDLLDRTRSGEDRASVEVTSEDIASTFNQTTVQEEIRTVVRNNFVGNPAAEAVFSALLMELSEAPTGEGLEDAAQRILNRLKTLDTRLAWLGAHGHSAHGEIERMLRDFVERELVKRHSGSRPAFSLRFPHHLPVLRPADPEAALRAQVEAMARAGESRRTVRSVFDRSEIENLRYVLNPNGNDAGMMAAFAASAWPTILTKQSGGVLDLLGGIASVAVVPGDQLQRQRLQPQLVVEQPDVATLGAVIEERTGAHLPPPLLLGGTRLARWALSEYRVGRMFEVAALGRVSRASLAWWFERVHCLEFADVSAIDRILERTSGMPALLSVFEEELLRKPGETKSREDLTSALDAMEGRIAEIAQELRNEGSAHGLTAREVEILRMVVAVGRDTDFRPAKIREDLVEGWDDFYREALDAAALSDDDFVALSVLQRLGFLPIDPKAAVAFPLDRLTNLHKDDALLRLVGALEKA